MAMRGARPIDCCPKARRIPSPFRRHSSRRRLHRIRRNRRPDLRLIRTDCRRPIPADAAPSEVMAEAMAEVMAEAMAPGSTVPRMGTAPSAHPIIFPCAGIRNPPEIET